jgi:hypothetical protein
MCNDTNPREAKRVAEMMHWALTQRGSPNARSDRPAPVEPGRANNAREAGKDDGS